MEEPTIESPQVPEKSKASLIRYDSANTVEDALSYALMLFDDYEVDEDKVRINVLSHPPDLFSEYPRIFKLTLTIEEI